MQSLSAINRYNFYIYTWILLNPGDYELAHLISHRQYGQFNSVLSVWFMTFLIA